MRLFVRVAELGSFARAARRLGIAKSTASKHVRLLEERLGVQLLVRHPRRLALTPAGEVWLEHCRRVLAELEAAERRLAGWGDEPRGRLRVSVPMSFGLLHLAPVLPRFLGAHPHIELELLFDDRRVDLLAEGYDLAIRIGTLPEGGLVARRLGAARARCVASPDDLARRGRPVHPRELAAHECLRYLYGPDPGSWTFERDGERLTVAVSGRFSANNGEALRDPALAALGIARLPSFIVDRELAAGRLDEVLGEWGGGRVGIHLLYPSHHRTNPAVRALVDYLSGVLGRPGPNTGRGREAACGS